MAYRVRVREPGRVGWSTSQAVWIWYHGGRSGAQIDLRQVAVLELSRATAQGLVQRLQAALAEGAEE